MTQPSNLKVRRLIELPELSAITDDGWMYVSANNKDYKINMTDVIPILQDLDEGDGITLDRTDPHIPVVSIDGNYLASATEAIVDNWMGDNLAPVAISGSYDDLVDKPTAADIGAEPAFSKGNLIAGDNITLSGTLAGRLVGSGDVTITAASGGGGGGQVDSVVAGTGIDVDDSDPENPEVSLSSAATASLALADTAVQPADLADVATSGSYNDLDDKPTIPAYTSGSGILIDDATISGIGAGIVEVTGASVTLGLAHANRCLKCNSASAQSITIPAQSTVAWPDDAQIEGWQHGAGAVTFIAAAGVNIRRNSKITATTDGQYAPWGLKRIGLNEWLLFGQMASA